MPELTYNGLFEARLKARIADERERRRQHMEFSGGIDDYASYQRAVGYLAALRDVCDVYCADVNTEINQQ